jgi:2-amino-4-hydroxy-6-hydroxymethyldihydropteridine diphosphokinase
MAEENIFLSLGSNLGDRLANLQKGIVFLENQIGMISAKSAVYETSAWGKEDQSNFLNQAIQLESKLSPEELLAKIHVIEKSMGRIQTEKWSERIIDMDLIYFGGRIINTPNLVVPHPLMTQRKFVLIPLAEISPEFIHPQLQKSNAALLHECRDDLAVNIFTN